MTVILTRATLRALIIFLPCAAWMVGVELVYLMRGAS